ncbi:MAG: NAD-dependent DNA ligase LigA [Clostridia bacterium]|nr:NAD-dependent DNA ligase LigA [Clostridia bacterium]
MQTNIKVMEKLVEEINKHCYNYYVLDTPTISDKEFDKLYDKLVQMEKETGTILPNSPTQRVGGDVLDGFEKHEHKYKLYSLNKCQTKGELAKWLSDIQTAYPEAEFTTEYKFDGLSLVCTYKDGIFQSAATRGNGSVGENVTEQAKTIKTLPLQIDFKGELIVQGEAMITLSNLAKFNANTTEQLKNARNAAAGAIRNLDPKKTAEKNLDWFAYTIHFAEGKKFSTQAEEIAFLKQNGFNVGSYFKVNKTAEEIFTEIDLIDEKRHHEDILMDGVVIRLNNIPHREEFGFTAKFPRWAMAYKFEAEEVSSILKNVVWQVGRTGKLTPIAEIEPVELAGATIKRATLNNYGDILKKQVEIGSRVFIRRSNEVIPEILGLAEKLEGSTPIDKPTKCPSCGSDIVEVGAHIFCPNRDGCPDQIVDRLTNFASKDGFDIDGLSISTISKLYEMFNIKQFHELFELTGQEFMCLEGFGGKKGRLANQVADAIQQSKNIPFNKFVYALGISEVGVKTAKDIVKKFPTLNDLKNATYEQILEIYNIGDVVAKNIYEYFHNPKNLEELDKLIMYGVQIQEVKKQEFRETIFNQKTVVLTGTMQKYDRKTATEILEGLNASVVNSVSKNTDFVIAGENAGSKLTKAKTLGVTILNEDEFLKHI